MPKFQPGQRCIVISFHPNPFPTENTRFASDGLNGGLMVQPMVFRSAAMLRKMPREAGRCYVVESAGVRAEDGAPLYRAITRLCITRLDEMELQGRSAPGIEEAAAYFDNGIPSSEGGGAPSP